MVAVPNGPAESGGQQIHQVVPVDGEAVRGETALQLGGGTVVTGSDARRDDRDPARVARCGPLPRNGARKGESGRRASGVGHGLFLRT
ncbi:hypothetical protein ACWCQN_39635 [Streptomyces sp. NPDC001984]|uniref:hypothetical protein n=1 Tax=Streptomyces sp. NPDC002619 TaxID=3364655 RepID=UPI0036BC314F